VGCPPAAPGELETAVNELEQEMDPDLVWRRHVDACLGGPYAALWAELDALVVLAAPHAEPGW
jgi:D-glycerate 3-kinase